MGLNHCKISSGFVALPQNKKKQKANRQIMCSGNGDVTLQEKGGKTINTECRLNEENSKNTIILWPNLKAENIVCRLMCRAKVHWPQPTAVFHPPATVRLHLGLWDGA